VALATRPRGRRDLPLTRLVRSEEPPPTVDLTEGDSPVELCEGESGT